MSDDAQWRDYSLTGADSCPGFASAEWYSTPITRKRIKEFMKRSDRLGLMNYGIWLALLAGTGTWMSLAWGTWWAVPAALLYGVFYGSCADSRWHECAHGTVFKTRRLSDFFLSHCFLYALKKTLTCGAGAIADTIQIRSSSVAIPRSRSHVRQVFWVLS